MIYGLYLSAAGVMAQSHRVDVIANNLANSETVGFKRSLASFKQRDVASEELGQPQQSDALLDHIGGGLLLQPTAVDHSQGIFDQTNGSLDVAVHGSGYLAVQDGKNTRLTRDGRMMLDREGNLILADGSNHRVLDVEKKPLNFDGVPASQISIGADGTINAAGQVVGQLGLFNVGNEDTLKPLGGGLMQVPADQPLNAADGTIAAGYVENSNVDPMTEMTQLIESQRQLEMNANMIKAQDATWGRLVNDVAKIS